MIEDWRASAAALGWSDRALVGLDDLLISPHHTVSVLAVKRYEIKLVSRSVLSFPGVDRYGQATQSSTQHDRFWSWRRYDPPVSSISDGSARPSQTNQDSTKPNPPIIHFELADRWCTWPFLPVRYGITPRHDEPSRTEVSPCPAALPRKKRKRKKGTPLPRQLKIGFAQPARH